MPSGFENCMVFEHGFRKSGVLQACQLFESLNPNAHV